MTDLITRLLEAIGETERLAREASPGPWRAYRDSRGACVVFGDEQRVVVDTYASHDERHILRNDPPTVLRRCAADRKLIERDGPFCDCGEFGPPTNPDTGQPIPHHYDCSAYQAAQILAESYGLEADA